MSSTWKNNIEITIFGESHGKAIGIILGNLPAGIKIDMDEVAREMKRRAPGRNKMSTPRKEADNVEVVSGLYEGITTGAPLCGMIYNCDQHSKDYSLLKEKMRPGHSDYPAFVKYQGFNDVRGGGHFSGRITAPIVFAGAIAKQILAKQGIHVGAHILSIKDIYDEYFDMRLSNETLNYLSEQQYPVLNKDIYDQFVKTIDEARMNQDSVGGKIECAIIGLKAGLGDPFFDSIESHLSSLLLVMIELVRCLVVKLMIVIIMIKMLLKLKLIIMVELLVELVMECQLFLMLELSQRLQFLRYKKQ